MPADPLHFSPPDDSIAAIFDDLNRPDTTLREIAESRGATIDALTLWMARPDIAARLSALESGIARRTRMVAANYLTFAVKAVAGIIREYNDEENNTLLNPNSRADREQRRRARETARRAASLLLRLAKFSPCGMPAAFVGHALGSGSRAHEPVEKAR